MNGKTIFWTVRLAVLYLVLNTHCRGYHGIGVCLMNGRTFCCSSFELKNGICTQVLFTRCLMGFNSEANSTCKPCTNGMYGLKCKNTCTCNSNERCNHIEGCIFDGQTTNRNSADTDTSPNIERITPSVKSKEEGDIIISITLRELILIMIIILLSLFILYGLLQKYRKRQKRALINPLNHNEEETNEFRREHQEVEERTESVYNEIDESAIKTLPSRKSFHHSYFEITNSLSSTIHIKANSTPNSLCSSRLYSAKGSTNDLHIAIGSEYSDGYLRPMFIAQLQSMDTRIEPQGTALSNNDNEIRIQNDGYVYKESTYAGIGRSMSYNKLMLKDVRNQTQEIGVVDNPIYHDTVHQHPKYATWSSKRKTI